MVLPPAGHSSGSSRLPYSTSASINASVPWGAIRICVPRSSRRVRSGSSCRRRHIIAKPRRSRFALLRELCVASHHLAMAPLALAHRCEVACILHHIRQCSRQSVIGTGQCCFFDVLLYVFRLTVGYNKGILKPVQSSFESGSSRANTHQFLIAVSPADSLRPAFQDLRASSHSRPLR